MKAYPYPLPEGKGTEPPPDLLKSPSHPPPGGRESKAHPYPPPKGRELGPPLTPPLGGGGGRELKPTPTPSFGKAQDVPFDKAQDRKGKGNSAANCTPS